MSKELKKTKPYIVALFVLATSLPTHASWFYTPDGGKDKDDEWMNKTKAPQKHQPVVSNNDSYIQVSRILSSTPVTLLLKDETGAVVYEQIIAPEIPEITIPIMDLNPGSYQLELFSDSMDYVVWPIMKY